ncbi:RNA polymerase sigma factor [Nocardioides sp.]|uniref:RNA polymerase sigma factor n=1 Tax=Nocardioides sp. TaxID=35761 RepID=UPI0035664C11
METVGRAEQRRARFEAIARELIDPLRRFLVRRTDPATADDVLADTLLVCWRRFDDLPADPLPWAYAVARGCLLNAERSARRQRRVAARVATLDPPVEAVEVPEADRGPDPGLAEAMASLRAEDAELLRLWAWEQLTVSEIATVLDITPNAAGVRLSRARRRLVGELGKNDAGAGHEKA